jgi:hypothetical protein
MKCSVEQAQCNTVYVTIRVQYSVWSMAVQYSVCYSAIQCMLQSECNTVYGRWQYNTVYGRWQYNTVYVTVQYSVWYSIRLMAVQSSVCYSAIHCMVQSQCNTVYRTNAAQCYTIYYNNSKVQATPDGEEDAKIKMRKLSNNVKISRIKCCHQMYRSIAILKTQL